MIATCRRWPSARFSYADRRLLASRELKEGTAQRKPHYVRTRKERVAITDLWLQKGNPSEIVRPNVNYYVPFDGHTEMWNDAQGRLRVRWLPARMVKGVACDTPMPGFRVNTCNTLRLWKSEAIESFGLEDFNASDYYQAVQEKVISETLSKVLYPNDEREAGKRLRLAQQYFFVSCSLPDMLCLLDLKGEPVSRFAEMFTARLNDTHPAIAVAELMRLLVDERLLSWEEAWDITRRTLAYTNHTLARVAIIEAAGEKKCAWLTGRPSVATP